jgi:hypothetical protein
VIAQGHSTFVEEQYEETWAKDLKKLLLEMKMVTEQARHTGQRYLRMAIYTAFMAPFDALLVMTVTTPAGSSCPL